MIFESSVMFEYRIEVTEPTVVLMFSCYGELVWIRVGNIKARCDGGDPGDESQ